MAAEATLGTTHVFQVLFVDELNTPIVVTSPVIDVYYFDTAGDRVDLVSGSAMTAVVPAETGRYVFPVLISTLTFSDGDTLYGTMSGVDPSTLLSTHIEQTVNLVSSTRATGGSGTFGGLRAQFVKGG